MSSEHRNALPAGHEIQGYRVESVLGVGGFGVTYLATDRGLGRRVAIKEYLPNGLAHRVPDDLMIRPSSPADMKDYFWGLERFRQEAETLVNFHHPNIVGVHRFFEANGTAYLVMQYVEGDSLDQILTRQRSLSEIDTMKMLLPILDGLEEVHKLGFLHRDVKPANIYIRTDGSPILLDFSAARQAMNQKQNSMTAIVSDGYAPYEQYGSGGQLGPWTDIYGLGAVLYRCVSGQRPMQAPDRLSAVINGGKDPLPPASVLGRGRFNAALLAAVDASLKVFEKDRPQSIAQLRAMVQEQFVDGPAGRSRPPGAPNGDAISRNPASRNPISRHPISRQPSRPPSRPPMGEPDAPSEKRPEARIPLSQIATMVAIVVVVAAASFFAGLRTGSLGWFESRPPATRLGAAPSQNDLANAEPAAGDAATPQLYRPDRASDRFATRAEFARFVGATGHKTQPGCHVWIGAEWRLDPAMTWQSAPPAAGDAVACVSARDAEAFLRWLSRETGRAQRMTADSEWRDLASTGAATWSWTAGCWAAGDCDYRAVRQGEARLRGHADLRAANIGFRIAAEAD